jgi:hypothetical protein
MLNRWPYRFDQIEPQAVPICGIRMDEAKTCIETKPGVLSDIEIWTKPLARRTLTRVE